MAGSLSVPVESGRPWFVVGVGDGPPEGPIYSGNQVYFRFRREGAVVRLQGFANAQGNAFVLPPSHRPSVPTTGGNNYLYYFTGSSSEGDGGILRISVFGEVTTADPPGGSIAMAPFDVTFPSDPA